MEALKYQMDKANHIQVKLDYHEGEITKVEEAKPTPKWKKPESAKKEEPKAAEPKPTPKWGKKAEPAKVEKPKP